MPGMDADFIISPGHRLEGRYKAKLVQNDEYLMTLTRYIHLNPVKITAFHDLGKAEIRRRLNAYRWSSYGGYIYERRREEFVCYDVINALDKNPRRACTRYRAYVQDCLVKDDDGLLKLLDRSGHGVGDEEYVEALEQELRERKDGAAQDRGLSGAVRENRNRVL